jgi:hypothetical protein
MRDKMLRKLLLTTALLAIAAPAQARLQISITANGATFSCFDGQLSCDDSGGANNLLTINTTVGGAFVQLSLAQSFFGSVNDLQLSSSNIINETSTPITIGLFAGDTNFVAPTKSITESGSLTFNSAVGSGPSTLSFFADPANVQGANPTNTPGIDLLSTSGTPVTNPDSFSGTNTTGFVAGSPFSMTETASLNLIGGASVTGFDQSMQSSVPEASTWVMLALGFVGLGFAGRRRAGPRAPLNPLIG